MNVVLFGSTGLIGSLALKNLLEDVRVHKVITVTRNSSSLKHPKLINIVSTFEDLNKDLFIKNGVQKIDGALCALGTTIKKAKTKEAFRKVDYEYVLKSCDVAIELGAEHFAVISAEGANAQSSIFYSKTKGEMENGLIDKKIKSLFILRPGLLLGEREESRPMEKMFITISPVLNRVLVGSLKQYRAIQAEKVAYFLTRTLFESNFGTRIIKNIDMLD